MHHYCSCFYAGNDIPTIPPFFNFLNIDYGELEVDEQRVVIKWTPDNCSMLYELQGFTLAKIANVEMNTPDIFFRKDNLNFAEIPSANFNTTNGDAIYYRLVALNPNNFTICSNRTSRLEFYTFNGMYKIFLVNTI